MTYKITTPTYEAIVKWIQDDNLEWKQNSLAYQGMQPVVDAFYLESANETLEYRIYEKIFNELNARKYPTNDPVRLNVTVSNTVETSKTKSYRQILSFSAIAFPSRKQKKDCITILKYSALNRKHLNEFEDVLDRMIIQKALSEEPQITEPQITEPQPPKPEPRKPHKHGKNVVIAEIKTTIPNIDHPEDNNRYIITCSKKAMKQFIDNPTKYIHTHKFMGGICAVETDKPTWSFDFDNIVYQFGKNTAVVDYAIKYYY